MKAGTQPRTNPKHSLISCSHCGHLLPENSLACPHCGADPETGWSPQSKFQYLGLPLPLDEEGYREVVSDASERALPRRPPWQMVVALIGLLAFMLTLLRWLA